MEGSESVMFRFFLVFITVLFPLFCEQIELVRLREELGQLQKSDIPTSHIELLNVSYDPTREFYENYNKLFENWWKEKTTQEAFIVQSHGGSGIQARAVISGLEADVVSLALALDIDAIQKLKGLVGENWQNRLPNNSCPYYSTIVFLVRKGNPKKIKDWNDLTRKDIQIVMPNPKTSGGARWAYMAAWAWALKEFDNQFSKVKEYMVQLYANSPLLDAGARASTTTFVQRKMGDVLITWENEAYLTLEKIDSGQYEIIYPSMSIKAEPPVTWLNKVIKEHETEDVAKFYLKYLYSLSAQELIAKSHFRPYDQTVLKNYQNKFPDINLVNIADCGGWEKVQNEQFKDGGLFDQIFEASQNKKQD